MIKKFSLGSYGIYVNIYLKSVAYVGKGNEEIAIDLEIEVEDIDIAVLCDSRLQSIRCSL